MWGREIVVELEPGQERRSHQGIAVISLRRVELTRRLKAAHAPFRHIVPQLGPTLVPELRPPLLLDTIGMPLPMLVAILWELSRARNIMPTLALVPPDQPGLARLIALPRSVHALVADDVTDETLGLWARMAHLIERRPGSMAPVEVGMPMTSAGMVNLPAYTLDALHALSPFGGKPPATMTEAAQRAGISRRLFCYQLAAIRAVVGIPSDRRYRPPALASTICAAIAAGDGAMPRQSSLIPQY